MWESSAVFGFRPMITRYQRSDRGKGGGEEEEARITNYCGETCFPNSPLLGQGNSYTFGNSLFGECFTCTFVFISFAHSSGSSNFLPPFPPFSSAAVFAVCECVALYAALLFCGD